MICVSLGFPTVALCLKALEVVDFAEIRLDLMDVKMADLPALFAGGKRLIATCRPGTRAAEERKNLLLASLAHGAAYVDIEHDAPADYRRAILRAARKEKARVIVSYHNDEETPASAALRAVVRRSFRLGADLAKVACRVHSPSDAARLLGLLGDPAIEGKLVVAGMGRSARAVRVIAPFFGSPFTYASLARGNETAEGQIPFRELAEILRKAGEILRES